LFTRRGSPAVKRVAAPPVTRFGCGRPDAHVALRIAVAKQYITTAEAAEVEVVLDRVRAMLYRLTK
jgi:hypothetical protein